MRSECCDRCPDEDTDVCDTCKLIREDAEKKLWEILDKERERIRGD